MRGKVFRIEEVPWSCPPGHYDAFSKMLITPENSETRDIDFRISIYRPQGYAESHQHETAENIYYIIKGTGLVELDGEKHVVGANTVVYMPPGVKHGIWNTGLEDLVLIFLAVPAQDMPKVER